MEQLVTTTLNGKRPDSTISKWLDNAGRYPLLATDAVLEIAKCIQELPEGDPTRTRLINKLVKHNLRLVTRFVKSFMKTSHQKWGSPETVDYLQVGAMGLMRAAEKYDPCKGYAFSTYANHWIRSAVSRYNMKTLTPVHVSESTSRQVVFCKRNGFMKTKANGRKMTDRETRNVLESVGSAYRYLSLDATLPSGNSHADLLADDREDWDPISCENKINDAMDAAGINALGRRILVAHYIDGLSLAEIGRIMGISKYTILRAKKKAVALVHDNAEAFRGGIL
jgi:RNA polymerase sigma factor (sigma-70 family)